MLLHQLAEAVDVDGLAALLRELLRQLDREAVRRRERERILGRDRVLAGEVVEDLHPACKCLRETLLLFADDTLDRLCVLAQLGVGVPHLFDHGRRQLMHVREPDAARLIDGAPDDPAADVSPTLIRRKHAFGDQEARGAAVIGQHAMRALRYLAVAVGDARLLLNPVHDQPEAVGVED